MFEVTELRGTWGTNIGVNRRHFVGKWLYFSEDWYTFWDTWLGGGNSNIFYVHPGSLGKMSPIWRLHIFSDGLVQPVTRYYLNRLLYIHSTIFSTIALFKNLPMGPGVQFVGFGWGAIKGGHQFRAFVTWQAEILACFIDSLGKKWQRFYYCTYPVW